MLNDLFWHGMVMLIGLFFAFTAITRLPAWNNDASVYAAPAYHRIPTQTASIAQHQHHRAIPMRDVQLARAR